MKQVLVSEELLRQVIEKAEATTRHFNIERLGESTYKDTNTRCELHEAVNKLRVALEQPAVLTAPVGDSNFESWYATYDPSGKGDKQRARDAYAAALEQPAVEPIDGDILPPIGSRVFIRHGSDGDAHACTVTGYYAWGDLGGDKYRSRVFVRLVYEGTNVPQVRILCDCYPSAEAALNDTPPAKPAVEPRNHVGNSKFESWYSEYNASGKGDKQRARDAYAAGMGDPVYLPSPPPPAEVLKRASQAACDAIAFNGGTAQMEAHVRAAIEDLK